ncbi:hemerythrin [Thiorhodococcus mannitoliphagus]|uniref:Hemerythrin n=1 Tax=Thiorhodococcus mannitoliphagus TaxID=329406 RepID=A0A6P1DUH3_9GAMM|nr:hemerythrin domain-containing protein [Thiorhodococcus mannitoliphagus]NEX21120.1 hemerythrin [Thiorhodococcus mannitoliphagus]
MSELLIDPDNARFRLGVPDMDSVHFEFIDLVNAMAEANQARFLELFERLVEHTLAHFEREEQWMTETGFPALQEHRADHQRVLGDLKAIGQRTTRGKLALGRAYVREQLPGWFALHAATMDSALAAHLKSNPVS